MLNRHRAGFAPWQSWWVAAPAVVALTLVPHRMVLLAQEPNPLEGLEIPATLEAGSQLAIESSDAMQRINEALGPRFFQQYGNTEIAVNYSDSETAIQALRDRRVDLAAIGRGLTPEEEQAGLRQVPVARHKIAIVTSPENPFEGTLTIEQFAQIFRGDITNWSEVGGPDAPIELIDRPVGSDTRQAFLNYPVFQAAPFEAAPNATTLAKDSTTALVEAIGPNRLGYAIANQVIDNPAVKVVPMHDTLPDDERYPFSQPLAYVYRAEDPTPPALAYLGYAINPDNATVIAEAQAAATQEEAAAAQEAVGAEGALPPAGTAPDGTAPPVIQQETVVENETLTSETIPSAEPPLDGGAAPDRSRPWWPWILSLPILGGLLWWLMRGAAPTAAPAVAPAVIPVADDLRRIILTPRNCRDAYAYWELPESEVAALRRQNYSLGLKLHDVTDIANVDQQAPHSSQLVPCETVAVGDHHLPIARDDRDYLAELGYLDEAKSWHALARSAPVRVPACPSGEPAISTPAMSADSANSAKHPSMGMAGAVAAGAVAGSVAAQPLMREAARVVLTPRDCRHAYAYWEIPPTQVTELQSSNRNLKLRLYDVTELPGSANTSPNSLQEFAADLSPQGDLAVPIAIDDRDYLVELGYTSDTGQWQTLAKSDLVRVPACADAVAWAAMGNGLRPQTEFTPGAEMPAVDVAPAEVAPVDMTTAEVAPAEAAPVADSSVEIPPIAAAGLGWGMATAIAPKREPDPVPELLLAADAIAPDAGMAAEPAAEITNSRIILVPRSAESAYAYWEAAATDKAALKAQGGRVLALRIHDATALELDHQPAHRTQEYILQETDQDKPVSVPVPDRDYVAELGYLTDSGDWLMLMRSLHVRLP